MFVFTLEDVESAGRLKVLHGGGVRSARYLTGNFGDSNINRRRVVRWAGVLAGRRSHQDTLHACASAVRRLRHALRRGRIAHTRRSARTFTAARRTIPQSAAFDTVSIVPSIRRA